MAKQSTVSRGLLLADKLRNAIHLRHSSVVMQKSSGCLKTLQTA